MEAIKQAREQYVKCHTDRTITGDCVDCEQSKLQLSIRIAIKEISSSTALFENSWMMSILRTALNIPINENSDVVPTAGAFESLENYFLLLLKQPWKPEFRKLKTYGGFYRTKVKSFLPNLEWIFEAAGYSMDKENHVLIHNGPMNAKVLVILSFDCKVASMLCHIIADDYAKGKSAGMSLRDSVDKYLHESWTRGKVNMATRSAGSSLPSSKWAPKINGIHTGSEVSSLHSKQNNNRTEKPELVVPSNVRKRVVASSLYPDGLTYMDAADKEILPELPQGTCDEHMRESLKLVDMHQTKYGLSQSEHPSRNMNPQESEDWKWYSKQQVVGADYDRPSDVSNPFAATTYPPGHLKMNHRLPPSVGASIDEGIENDYSSNTKSFSYSQNPLNSPGKMHSDLSQRDQGYATRTSSSLAYNFPSSQSPFQSQAMYYPHTVNLGAERYHGRTATSSCNPPPPPHVPSRALKPVINFSLAVRQDDMCDGQSQAIPSRIGSENSSYSSTSASSGVSRIPTNNVDQGRVLVPQVSNVEPLLRRNVQLMTNRSHSLKSPAVSTDPLPSGLMSTRTSKSMDCNDLKWKCSLCRAVNKISSSHCKMCSGSREIAPSQRSSLVGQSRKICPQCTFANKTNSRICEMCDTSLTDNYTDM